LEVPEIIFRIANCVVLELFFTEFKGSIPRVFSLLEGLIKTLFTCSPLTLEAFERLWFKSIITCGLVLCGAIFSWMITVFFLPLGSSFLNCFFFCRYF